ncbi:MAG: sigma-54-dependent transcriptional regulator [Kofleriaceae bacterium]
MASTSANILIVDDDADTRMLLAEGLARRGFATSTAASGMECLERLRTEVVDVVLADVQMHGISGIELCSQLRDRYPDVLPIVITGQGSLDVAVSAIRAGAFDFIPKPIKLDALAIAINRALDHASVKREVRRLRTDFREEGQMVGIAGDSQAIRETLAMVRRVADSDATVLITGESGTGKELVARSLHALSSRRDQPFVAVNCAAMPAPLLESELFGHLRGAFTDAKRSRPGLFVQAGSGTIFLDEIGEMPTEMQVKLLRVLQERKIRPVGGDEEVPIEARVITATNRDLEREVHDGRFREDLYYRVNVVAIGIPPLRDRDGDVLQLARFFLDRIAARTGKRIRELSPAAARKLADYDWPGNVRELENCIERAVALCRTEEITLEDLPSKVRDFEPSRFVIDAQAPSELMTLDEMERRYVRQVLASVGGNKTHAARILGIDRRSLYRRLEPTAGGPIES